MYLLLCKNTANMYKHALFNLLPTKPDKLNELNKQYHTEKHSLIW